MVATSRPWGGVRAKRCILDLYYTIITEHEIADIVVYLKLPSRETIKRKHTTALQKPGEEPWGEPWEQRAAGCCDSQPAIPLVFADGSLRTHKDKLVGIRASFEKYRCVPKIASPEARKKFNSKTLL